MNSRREGFTGRNLGIVIAGFAPVLLLAGCGSAGKAAEQRYAVANKAGNAAERCRVGREVADAYLEEKDEAKYRYWLGKTQIDCALAKEGLD